jgi:hypothetical protein
MRWKSTILCPYLRGRKILYNYRREYQWSWFFHDLNEVFQHNLSKLVLNSCRLKKLWFSLLNLVNKLDLNAFKIQRGRKYNGVENSLIEVKLTYVMLVHWDILYQWIILKESHLLKIIWDLLEIEFRCFQNYFPFYFVLFWFLLLYFLDTHIVGLTAFFCTDLYNRLHFRRAYNWLLFVLFWR